MSISSVGWESLVAIVHSLGLESCLLVRGEVEPSEWSRFLLIPSPSYIEANCGPVKLEDIECLLINPVQTVHRGIRVAPSRVDHSAKLVELLSKAGATSVVEGGCFKVLGFERK
ncbi:MAG: hypothetical protein H4O13_15615 [Xanthomonadales bacterium]|nr:hypothetical protein [Xanthomonadales bacterium]